MNVTTLAFTKPDLTIIKDALRVYVAMVTEEYQNNPTLEGANKMDKVVKLCDRMNKHGKL
jgi:hypothetical protein